MMMMVLGRLLDGRIYQVNQYSDDNENENVGDDDDDDDDDDNGAGQAAGWQDFPGKPV